MNRMKKAVLAGVCLKDTEENFAMKMEECASLCLACNLEVSGTIIQNSYSMDQKTAFRKGKLEELKNLVEMTDADLVVFYNPLRVQMAERIADACGTEVIDRTSLILDIFSMRARTRQAKLQTEMARLQYDLPRILNSDNDNRERSRGGSVTNRGSGEMRSSLVARKYQNRIQSLKKELQKIDKQRSQDERRRSKTMMRRVALVGYTNAGKSSILNCLMCLSSAQGSEVMEKDMLFATLDTSVRMIHADAHSFLLYDTVGFVSDLPHTLIDAFHSTLDSARDADLLIHVVDASDPQWSMKASITRDTLHEIGAGEIPVLTVYNKTDLLAKEHAFEGICVSAKTGEGMKDLSQAIVSHLYPHEKTIHCHIPYDRMAMLDAYRQVLEVKEGDCDEEGMHVVLSGPQRYLDAFRNYRIDA